MSVFLPSIFHLPSSIFALLHWPAILEAQRWQAVSGPSVRSARKTPAIALTAYARAEDRTKAILAGYQVHVTKPVEPAELLANIASLAGRTGPT